MDNEESNQVVNEQVAQDTTATESASVETQSESSESVEVTPVGVQDDSGEVTLQQTTAKEEDDSESEKSHGDDQQAESEEPPKKGAEGRKEQLNTEIRDLVAERNRVRQEVEQMQRTYKVPSVEELLEQENPETGDYYTKLEAKVEAMEQKAQVDQYINQVAESKANLNAQIDAVLQEFPEFNPLSPNFNKEVAEQAYATLQASLVYDQNTGQVIGSSVPPYQLYKPIAMASRRAAEALAATSQASAQRAAEQQLASTDHIGSGQAPAAKTYEKMSLTEKAAYLRKKGYDV